MKLKILIYNLSLLPLYIIYFIKSVNMEINKLEYKNIGIYIPKFSTNYQSILFLILIIVSMLSLVLVRNSFLNRGNIISDITDIKKRDYEYFTFLSVFILPIFGINLESIKDLMILFFILLFMGYIYIKGDFLYLNPIYLTFGWYLYEGIYKNRKIIFLSDDENMKNEIDKGYIIKQISKDFYFVKRLKNGNK